MRGSFFWRNTSLRPKFFWVADYTSSFAFVVFGLHMREWTFWLAVAITIILAIVAHFGFTLAVLIRRLAYLLGGSHRPARTWSHWDRLDSNNGE